MVEQIVEVEEDTSASPVQPNRVLRGPSQLLGRFPLVLDAAPSVAGTAERT